MTKRHDVTGPARYEIHVAAGLDGTWSNWFEAMAAEPVSKTRTRLVGDVDQAALHGVLARIRDLGLHLISVARVEPSNTGEASTTNRTDTSKETL